MLPRANALGRLHKSQLFWVQEVAAKNRAKMGLRTLRVQYVLSYQCSHEALDDVEISRGKTRNSLLHIVSREHYMVNFAPCFLPKLLVLHGLATYVVERGLTPQAMFGRPPSGAGMLVWHAQIWGSRPRSTT